MKNLIFLLIIFTSCEKKNSEIQYVNLYKTTIIGISCEELIRSSEIKTLILTKEETTKLLKIFAELKSADSDWNIDARVSGFIYENSTKLNFCMSTTIIEIKSKKYFVNDNLRDYIVKITNE